jgi:hypothetical protein
MVCDICISLKLLAEYKKLYVQNNLKPVVIFVCEIWSTTEMDQIISNKKVMKISRKVCGPVTR